VRRVVDDDRQGRASPVDFPDPTLAVLVVSPAIGAAYLLSKGHVMSGAMLLSAWVPLFALLAATLARRGLVRTWMTLTGGIAVFAVSVMVFFWLPTP